MGERRIVVEPVTRVEGHGKIVVDLDEAGRVSDAFFSVAEFRGFEPYEDAHSERERDAPDISEAGVCDADLNGDVPPESAPEPSLVAGGFRELRGAADTRENRVLSGKPV